MRDLASDLARAETEAQTAEVQSMEGQDKEQGFFVRIKEFFASTFG